MLKQKGSKGSGPDNLPSIATKVALICRPDIFASIMKTCLGRSNLFQRLEKAKAPTPQSHRTASVNPKPAFFNDGQTIAKATVRTWLNLESTFLVIKLRQ